MGEATESAEALLRRLLAGHAFPALPTQKQGAGRGRVVVGAEAGEQGEWVAGLPLEGEAPPFELVCQDEEGLCRLISKLRAEADRLASAREQEEEAEQNVRDLGKQLIALLLEVKDTQLRKQAAERRKERFNAPVPVKSQRLASRAIQQQAVRLSQ